MFGGFAKVPSQEFVFVVELPIAAVWSFINNRTEVGCLFPGCNDVKILNELDSLWTVSFSVGPFSRTIQVKGHTTESVENERIAWIVMHDLFTVSGITILRKITEEETEITYQLQAKATGHFTFLQEIVVGQKMRESAFVFVENIKKRLNLMAETKS